MKLRSWLPVILAFTAFGCGAERKIVGSAPASSELAAETAAPASAQFHGAPGAIYTMTNSPAGNAVLVYSRSASGRLSGPTVYPTGGTGTGASLGDQGALAFSEDGRSLYVVNAGSNDVTGFRVGGTRLELADRIASGGVMPVSVTAHGGLVYVLNAGGTGNIQGFHVLPSGALHAIHDSNRPLSADNAAAAQISFTPRGSELVVTEKATNRISLYHVNEAGRATGPVVQASSGQTPYGFGFDERQTLIVSEAAGSVSSYHVGYRGVSVVSASVPTHQAAPCWIAVHGNGRFAYTANAGGNSISGFGIGYDGSLTPLAGGATPTADGPLEMAFTDGSRFLYVLNGKAHAISTYTVTAQGALVAAGETTGIPAGVVGLVAR